MLMDRKNIYRLCTLIMVIFLVISCVKDITNIENNLVISASYALPLGDTTIADILQLFPGLDTIPIDGIDTIPVDSINFDSVLVFDDKVYKLPEETYFDTVIYIPFDFNLDQNDLIKELVVRLNVENAIPSEGKMQLSFFNGSNRLFDLYNDTLEIPFSGPGILNTYDSEPLTEDKIQSLLSANTILIYIGFELENGTSGIIYYPEQYLRTQMAVRVTLEKELRE